MENILCSFQIRLMHLKSLFPSLVHTSRYITPQDPFSASTLACASAPLKSNVLSIFDSPCQSLPPTDPTDSFEEKVGLVTEANCGFGFEAALKFTTLGASIVILASWSAAKGEAAATNIQQRTGGAGGFRAWELDMNKYDIVRELAEKRCRQTAEIGSLLNAGLWQPHFKNSPEGWEETLQVNVLSTMLLGILLLAPTEQSTAAGAEEGNDFGEAAHLCFVSSGNYENVDLRRPAHESSNLLHDYSHANHFARAEAQYNNSKLFLMYTVNELAAKTMNEESLAETVIVNFINTGVIATSLTRNITVCRCVCLLLSTYDCSPELTNRKPLAGQYVCT